MFVELQQHHFRLFSVTPFRPEHLRDFDFCWFGCFNQIRWEAKGDQSFSGVVYPLPWWSQEKDKPPQKIAVNDGI